MFERIRRTSFLTVILVAAVTLQPAIAAAGQPPSSAAVYALNDGDGDEESRDIARALTELMRLMTDLEIVDAERVREVAEYGQGEVRGGASEAAMLVSDAKEKHFLFKGGEARSSIEKAIEVLSGKRLDREVGPLALDAYLTKAMISSSAGDSEGMRAALSSALRIDPLLDLSSGDYPPSLIAALEEARDDLGAFPRGTLSVKSRPAGAEVYLNGIARGRAPVEVPDLPAGGYALTVSANRYLDDSRDIAVAPGEKVTVKSKLKWRHGDGNEPASNLDDGLYRGLSVARTLRVDRVVTLDVDSGDDGRSAVHARVVDLALRAGFKPLAIEGLDPDRRNDQLAELAERVAVQLTQDPLADPASLLDPVGEGDPLLLGKRKKPLTRRPLFWGAIGVAVAGAIAGGIAAAMASGGSDRGSLKVSFK